MAEPLKFTLHEAQKFEPLTDLVQRLTGTNLKDTAALAERLAKLARLCGIPVETQVWVTVGDPTPRPEHYTAPMAPPPAPWKGHDAPTCEDRADSGELPHPMGVAWPTPQVNAAGVNAHNVFTHRGSWRLALIIAREFADPKAAPDGNGHDDRAYWEHELRAFDATFSELTGQETETFTKAWGPAEAEAIRAAIALKNAPQVERQRVAADFREKLALAMGREPRDLDPIAGLLEAVTALARRHVIVQPVKAVPMATNNDSREAFVQALREVLGCAPNVEPNDLLEMVAMLENPTVVNKALADALGLPDGEYRMVELVERVAQARLLWNTLPGAPRRGVDLILNERIRQITLEGFTAAHDDRWTCGELASAAMCYLSTMSGYRQHLDAEMREAGPPDGWPWAPEWWKPHSPRRDLERAGALIAAELERMDRAGEA